jgi:hypothetical protein
MQILVALTYRKLENSPSKIAKILGFPDPQIKRELDDLVNDGLVSASNEKLELTPRAREKEPFIDLLINTRRIGKILLIASVFGLVLFIYTLNTYKIKIDLSIEGAFTIAFLILIMLFLVIGAWLYSYPKLVLQSGRK